MYQPPAFRETDTPVMHAFIEAHPLGLVIEAGGDPGLVQADLIPLLLYSGEGAYGTLRGHVARGNSLSQPGFGDPVARQALVVFQGPNHYITPSWYEQKAIDGRVVPTWSYAMVQARGSIRIIEDAAWLHAHVSALTERHERGRVSPWAVSDAPDAYVAGQLKGIVGIEIVIDRLEGKFKASQNRPPVDRAGVAEGLLSEPGPHAAAMRELVKQRGGI
jgi:transcriptional regulator